MQDQIIDMPEKPEHDEYEVIPVSPLRKLEKRIEELETTKERFSGEEFLKEVVDIIKMNQHLIEEMAQANDALKLEIAKLPAKIDALLENIGELVSYIKAAATEEATAPAAVTERVTEPLVGKLNELSEGNKRLIELTQTMVGALEELEKRLKRPSPPMMPPAMMRRPAYPPVQQPAR